MKIKIIFIIGFIFTINSFSQTTNCSAIVDEIFDVDGSLPNNWTEYNTSGRVTVEGGRLKFNHNSTKPSVFTTFDPVSNNATFSFDVSATRSSVNCQINLVSASGEFLSSIAVGVQTATIKYATSISSSGVPTNFTNGSPSVSFKTNTVYSVTAQVDFSAKTVDFSVNGVLMAADIPFLETATDIAKIDIQLIYMWSNTGQFYFDNISLLAGDKNRLQLTDNVNTAENLLSSAIIGTAYNQYSQVAVEDFQAVINAAIAVLSDCDSTSGLIDNTILELQTAQNNFSTSRVNEPILKMYNGYNFTGEEHEIYC
ncbi:MAG: hypothetical protein ABJG40_02995, partial [Polaribacter sp.]